MYDERNQYFVTCRLTKEYNVEPFFGEDAVKCHYRCQDHKSESDEFVITTHSDHVCEKETVQPRGDFRDWRSKWKMMNFYQLWNGLQYLQSHCVYF